MPRLLELGHQRRLAQQRRRIWLLVGVLALVLVSLDLLTGPVARWIVLLLPLIVWYGLFELGGFR
jgi:hypothetical protein